MDIANPGIQKIAEDKIDQAGAGTKGDGGLQSMLSERLQPLPLSPGQNHGHGPSSEFAGSAEAVETMKTVVPRIRS
jgi:hypothetical protein